MNAHAILALAVALVLTACTSSTAQPPPERFTQRESMTARDGLELSMRLPEGALHPGRSPVRLTVRNRSAETTFSARSYNAQVRGPDGKVIYDWFKATHPDSASLPAPDPLSARTRLGPGALVTQTLAVELPDPGTFDVVGSAAGLQTVLRVEVLAAQP